jgi:DnaJ-class molecular chaperone
VATDEQPGPTEPTPCPPCRGTGRVISNLGGEPHEQECPWCEGSGTFLPGHHAQAHWRSEGSEDSAA